MDFAYRPLVNKIAARFHKAFGGDMEIIRSEAYLQYARIAPAWQESLGPFATWINYKIWYGLIDWLRKETRREVRQGGKHETYHNDPMERERFDLRLLLSDLSDDAATIVGLVVDFERVGKRAKHKIAKHLLYDLGWAAHRVIDSFREIKEALG